MLREVLRNWGIKTLLSVRIAFLTAVLTAATAVLCVAPQAQALTTTPQKINFQGRLTDASGNMVLNGLYNMKFALYDAASGGNLKWSETRETTNRVQVTNGLFTVKLGDVAAFTDPTIFSTGFLYFEITLANPATATCSIASCQTWEAAMSRSQVATSAYAFNSETLDGLDSTDFVRNQNAAQQATTNFWLSGTGRADTALQAPAHDTATAVALTVGGTNASNITIGRASLAGTITLGNGTVSNTIAIGSAAGNTATQTITIGTSATAGSTTNVTIGSTVAGTTVLQGNVRLSKLTTNGFVKTSGSNGALSVSSTIALGSEVSGTLGIANGGTGVTGTPTNGQLLIGNGTGYALAALTGTGIAITNGAGSISLAASYGSVANTAVQGSITLTCPSGSGNVSGTGNAITLGSGGTCTSLNTVMNPNFTTSVTTPTLYATTLDTASAVAMNMGGTNASSINIGKSGSNITTTITGTAIIKPSTGNDSATAFQLQNASGAALFIADSTSSRLYIGPTAGNTTGVVLVLGNKTNAGDPTGVEGAMYYNSFAKAFRCYENGGWRNCVSNGYEVTDSKDEFLSGVSGSKGTWSAGELGWECRQTNGVEPPCWGSDYGADSNHPGILKLAATTDAANDAGHISTERFTLANFDRMTWIFKTYDNTNSRYTNTGVIRVGMFNELNSLSDTVSDGVYLQFNRGVSATNWYAISKNDGVETATQVAAIAANTWYRVEIVKNSSSNYEIYINGTLETTLSTNKPSDTADGMVATSIVKNINSAVSSGQDAAIDIDFFSIRTKGLTR